MHENDAVNFGNFGRRIFGKLLLQLHATDVSRWEKEKSI